MANLWLGRDRAFAVHPLRFSLRTTNYMNQASVCEACWRWADLDANLTIEALPLTHLEVRQLARS